MHSKSACPTRLTYSALGFAGVVIALLPADKARVDAAPKHQVFMRSLLLYLTLLHDNYVIRIPHSGQPANTDTSQRTLMAIHQTSTAQADMNMLHNRCQAAFLTFRRHAAAPQMPGALHDSTQQDVDAVICSALLLLYQAKQAALSERRAAVAWRWVRSMPVCDDENRASRGAHSCVQRLCH